MKKAPADRPHLVLVCVDALRADCLGGWAFDQSIWSSIGRPHTPALDELASQGQRFANAVASSSWTKPSVPSMLLSLHPSEHGVLEVAKNPRRAVRSTSLPRDVPTLAETLQASGYRTICLAHNAQLDPALGFSRGFDHFTSSAGSGEEILSSVRDLAPFDEESPVFLYLHYIEPHWPYRADVVRRAQGCATGRYPFHRFKASQWKTFKRELKKGGVELTPDEVDFLRTVYRFAVEAADAAVGRMVEWLDSAGALERSLLLVTADHGEELLDHGLVGHGQSLYEELVRVPFVLRGGTETAAAGLRAENAEELVSHVDIAPTLLDAAGREPYDHARGRSLLASAPGPSPGHCFSEVKHKRRYHHSVREGRYKLIRSYRFRKARAENGTEPPEDYNNLQELFNGRPFTCERKLFDLEADPVEAKDLADRHPDVADRLEAVLERWFGGLESRQSHVHSLEDEMIARLEALGYL